MNSIQDALSQLSEDMEKIEKDLDRYLEIFKRFQAEQKLDEIQNRLQNLIEQQGALDNEIDGADENPSTMDRLAQEEQRNLDEFKNIQSLVKDASEMIEQFNKNTANELSELSESELSEGLNVFYGNNGHGKSSLLEAIYIIFIFKRSITSN